MSYQPSRAKRHIVTVEIQGDEFVLTVKHASRTLIEKHFGGVTVVHQMEAYWAAKGIMFLLDAQGKDFLFINSGD